MAKSKSKNVQLNIPKTQAPKFLEYLEKAIVTDELTGWEEPPNIVYQVKKELAERLG